MYATKKKSAQDMEKSSLQRKRLVPGSVDSASESKIWHGRHEQAKAEYEAANKNVSELMKRAASIFAQLLDARESKSVAASAAPTLSAEHEAGLFNKIKDALSTDLSLQQENNTKDMQLNIQNLVREAQARLKQEISVEYDQKIKALEEEKDCERSETKQKLERIQNSFNTFNQSMCEDIAALRQQLHQSQADQKTAIQEIKTQASIEKADLLQELNTVKEELAVAKASIPRESVQELSTTVSDLSAAVGNAEEKDKKTVLELAQFRYKIDTLEQQQQQQRRAALAQEHTQTKANTVSSIDEQSQQPTSSAITALQASITKLFDWRGDAMCEMRDLEKGLRLLKEQFDHRDRSSTEPTSAIGTPSIDSARRTVCNDQTMLKAIKKESKEIKKWVLDELHAKAQQVDRLDALINKVKIDLALLQTLSDKTGQDQIDSSQALEELMTTVKVNKGLVEKDKTEADTRWADFELRLSSVKQHQDTMKTHEFAQFVINHIQKHTPGTLLYRCEQLSSCVLSLEGRVGILEGDSNKRRKVPNGNAVPVSNGQAAIMSPTNRQPTMLPSQQQFNGYNVQQQQMYHPNGFPGRMQQQ